MTTLKDKLKEFREKDWKALEDYSSAGIALSKIENFWTTAIQEALESLQGEEKSLEGRSMLNRCQFIGWNAREKKLREDSANFLGK